MSIAPDPLLTAQRELRAALLLARDAQCSSAQVAEHVERGWLAIAPLITDDDVPWDKLREAARAEPDAWARSLTAVREPRAGQEILVLMQLDWLDQVVQRRQPADGSLRAIVGPLGAAVLIVLAAFMIWPSVPDLSSRGPWRVRFYATKDFGGAVVRRFADEIQFDWGTSAPASGVPENGFSARFETCVRPKVAGPVVFRSSSDDGSRLYVDRKLVIDDWGRHMPRARTSSVVLDLTWHHVRVDYFESTGGASLKLSIDGDVELRVPAEADDVACKDP